MNGWTTADEAHLDEIGRRLDAFHEQHATPSTGSCWCCCLGPCDPDEGDLPPAIKRLQLEWNELVGIRQEALS